MTIVARDFRGRAMGVRMLAEVFDIQVTITIFGFAGLLMTALAAAVWLQLWRGNPSSCEVSDV